MKSFGLTNRVKLMLTKKTGGLFLTSVTTTHKGQQPSHQQMHMATGVFSHPSKINWPWNQEFVNSCKHRWRFKKQVIHCLLLCLCCWPYPAEGLWKSGWPHLVEDFEDCTLILKEDYECLSCIIFSLEELLH